MEHDDGSCPADLHTVFVRDLHYFHKVPHMINIAAVLVDVAAPISQKATAPAFTVVFGRRAALGPCGNLAKPCRQRGEGQFCERHSGHLYKLARFTRQRQLYRDWLFAEKQIADSPRSDGRRITRTHEPAC